MIQQIDEVPKDIVKRSNRDLIREDIQTAIDNKISKFEFVGDEYNYKYLQNYARQEAERITRRMIKRAEFKFRDEMLAENEKSELGFYLFFDDYRLAKKYILITSVKAEPHRRVFGTIDFSTFDDDVKDMVKNEIERVRKTYRWNGKKWERLKEQK